MNESVGKPTKQANFHGLSNYECWMWIFMAANNRLDPIKTLYLQIYGAELWLWRKKEKIDKIIDMRRYKRANIDERLLKTAYKARQSSII